MAARQLKLCLLGAILSASSLGYAESPPPAEPQSVLPLEDLRVFTKAYDHIRNAYIKEIDDKTLLEYAIRGMIDQLDPHSSYLDASSFDDLQVNTTGEFGGLGIEVGMDEGFVKVVSPIDGTPAEKAGILAGDIIVKIDDTTLKGLSLNDAVSKMRGPKGSTIVLTIIRKGEEQPIDIKIERDIIKVKSVRAELLDKQFIYLRIAQFQINTGVDMVNALKKLQQKHDIKGLVLDLRNNPGGVLQASVDVVSAFVDGGLVVYTEGRMEDSKVEFNAEPGDITNGMPLIVLINEGSASASEIVAGALQDHRRAVLVGTRSFGKGSVQTVIPITDDKAVKLTTALYFTPGGRSIQAQGIEPDIMVERADITAIKGQRRLTEAQLAGHLDNANGGGDVKTAERDNEKALTRETVQSKDNQLYEAINLLKGLALFSQQKASHSREE